MNSALVYMLHQITDYKSAEHSSDDILNIMKKPDLISNFSFSLWRHFSISENNKYQTSCKFLMRHEDLAMQASHITFRSWSLTYIVFTKFQYFIFKKIGLLRPMPIIWERWLILKNELDLYLHLLLNVDCGLPSII